MGLAERFTRHARQQGLLRPADRVLVACSGGADSVALLHLLADARDDLGLGALGIAHLDHGLRDGSRADAAFVAALGTSLGLPTTVERRPVSARAGESPEAAARRVRYAFLADAARAMHAGVVTTAHHLDDQAETVLLRVMTGTGTGGLAGIRPQRALAGAPAVRVVRPLLDARRAELRDYLRERDLPWREDPTNAGGNLRARLRSEALPLLDALAEREVAPLLARLSQNVREERAAPDVAEAVATSFLEQRPGAFVLHPGWARLPDALLVPLGRSALQHVRGDAAPPSRAETRRLLRALRGVRDESLAGVEVVARPGGGVRVERRGREPHSGPASPQPLPVPGEILWAADGGRVTASSGPLDAARVIRRLRAPPGSVELLDLARCALPLEVRQAVPGDRFAPLGSPDEMRVGHVFQRRGVPTDRRGRVPVVTDTRGILWVAGVGVADRARLREETADVLELTLHPRPQRAASER